MGNAFVALFFNRILLSKFKKMETHLFNLAPTEAWWGEATDEPGLYLGNLIISTQ